MLTVKVARLGNAAIQVQLREGSTVAAALESAHLDPSGYCLSVNGKGATMETSLQAGDFVAMVPQVKGGLAPTLAASVAPPRARSSRLQPHAGRGVVEGSGRKPRASVDRLERRMSKRYTVGDGKLVLTLEAATEGGFVVKSPLDPELVTEAETVEEAFANAHDALRALSQSRAKLLRQLSATASRR
jgi:antitoxin HicB